MNAPLTSLRIHRWDGQVAKIIDGKQYYIQWCSCGMPTKPALTPALAAQRFQEHIAHE